MQKKILLTGSTGFLGRNLKEKLGNKYNIFCPNRNELNLLDTKCVQDYLKREHFDIVIHAANTNAFQNIALSEDEVLNFNLQMFFNLERCMNLYHKMYYFGSGAEYDMQHYIPHMNEEYFDTYIPKDAYGFSKYIMSKVCEKSSNIYDLRLFGVYGKYEEWERRFISNAICKALKGKNITIQKNVYFDYLWVNDLCKIMEWFIEHDPIYKHYNVCTGNKVDLYSLAHMIKDILNIDCDIVVSKQGWKPEYTGNNGRLLNEIVGFKFEKIEKTIYELCEFYKANIDVIDESKLI